MMKELNQETLRAALKRLPAYTPPDNVWENIDTVLETDASMRNIVAQLPKYEAPAFVWGNITEHLSVERPAVRSMMHWHRYAVAAVLVGVLFGAWWLLRLQTNLNNTEQIVVTQETMDSEILATVRENEDNAFQWVQNLCASRAPICDQPAFISLKTELDELTEAKQQIHTALGHYGDDPELAKQLVQIEITRTQLLQEIMQLI